MVGMIAGILNFYRSSNIIFYNRLSVKLSTIFTNWGGRGLNNFFVTAKFIDNFLVTKIGNIKFNINTVEDGAANTFLVS